MSKARLFQVAIVSTLRLFQVAIVSSCDCFKLRSFHVAIVSRLTKDMSVQGHVLADQTGNQVLVGSADIQSMDLSG